MTTLSVSSLPLGIADTIPSKLQAMSPTIVELALKSLSSKVQDVTVLADIQEQFSSPRHATSVSLTTPSSIFAPLDLSGPDIMRSFAARVESALAADGAHVVEVYRSVRRRRKAKRDVNGPAVIYSQTNNKLRSEMVECLRKIEDAEIDIASLQHSTEYGAQEKKKAIERKRSELFSLHEELLRMERQTRPRSRSNSVERQRT
eukprot:GILK01006331.1.p1 GENE.GILK01006331.1~~GILK01006331.1.p1  ORF type:complete len:213 (+),score=34.42 GILK01006331.1:33-641(+)